nr:MAG TPA: hypothetical protein [Caudoviricetes sp.]
MYRGPISRLTKSMEYFYFSIIDTCVSVGIF